MSAAVVTVLGAVFAWLLMGGVRGVRGPAAHVAILVTGMGVVLVLVLPMLTVLSVSRSWAVLGGLAVSGVVIFEWLRALRVRVRLARAGLRPDRWADLRAADPLRSEGTPVRSEDKPIRSEGKPRSAATGPLWHTRWLVGILERLSTRMVAHDERLSTWMVTNRAATWAITILTLWFATASIPSRLIDEARTIPRWLFWLLVAGMVYSAAAALFFPRIARRPPHEVLAIVWVFSTTPVLVGLVAALFGAWRWLPGLGWLLFLASAPIAMRRARRAHLRAGA